MRCVTLHCRSFCSLLSETLSEVAQALDANYFWHSAICMHCSGQCQISVDSKANIWEYGTRAGNSPKNKKSHHSLPLCVFNPLFILLMRFELVWRRFEELRKPGQKGTRRINNGFNTHSYRWRYTIIFFIFR